ncbi:molybdopterin-dependent oxidoreductase [Duganella sp. BJB488]|uniref:molybdopterin-dependent oxidoreductase n=1 Tax=unclassified Duganella TaxID=2636909 RepID=UPI000E34C6E5|nr:MULTISPECIES: molybdopterin-dependent oxidoreductase [unclassified Duganella]NVD70658.1 molybdopterin-dependent oxidoreductase [Duganella sp. BJB1802]RFP24362.1 molybdopterin-dependent oxidoreductase [Duganella sp. BJB489]RFP26722.1 molybdopterin-dependent oxidoreductase [Duganella sp. BJB488]RFP34545.1 molybdopterin-dependent oxidoreductase [Duganella sp. BJB480]
MKKRQFLGRAALAGMAAAALPASQAAAANNAGPALLTVTGAVGKVNRGRFDPVRDQMMFKQKLSFDKAHAFDFAALAALPAITIQPTLEYDGKVHTLRGPLLLDVMRAAGASLGDAGKLVLRAVDGYAAVVTVAQARAQRYIVATHLDGAPMALGGLGPLWAVYDADKVPEMAAKPLAERFGSCPWALYHIEVQV